jgi:hypothetical protein
VTNVPEPPLTLKQKALRESQKLVVYTVYLALVFGIFNNYRRLVLSEYSIPYFNYGYAIIEALILAKVIMIGEAFGLGDRQRRENVPLIVPTLVNSLLFGIVVVAFSIVEKLVTGAIHHENLSEIGQDMLSKGRDEILARVLMMFVAFVPFFALIELQRALKNDSFLTLFFRKGVPAAAKGEAEN